MSGTANSARPAATHERPLRIAHIALGAVPASVGGLEIVVDSLIRHQRRLGHEAALITRWQQARAARSAGVPYPVHALPPFRSFDRRPFRAVPPRVPVEVSLSWHALRGKFDVIHAHWLFPTGWLAARVARRFGIPFVATAHGADLQTDTASGYGYRQFPANERRLREVAAQIDASVAISPNLAERLEDAGVPAERVHRIANGVDAARFADAAASREETRRRLGIGRDETLLLAVGRNQPSKGFSVLPHVLSLLRQEKCDVTCCIVGPGASELAPSFAAAGMSDHVRLLEAIRPAPGTLDSPPDELVALYGAADVFVFPSLSEGAPLVALEAMAAGLPVVGCDVQGIRDAIEHGKTGLLCPPRDASAMARAIAQLLDDAVQAQRMVAGAKAVARSHDWPAIAAQHVDLYRTLIAGSAR